jgi:C-terminal processing protease CtpA/Prc
MPLSDDAHVAANGNLGNIGGEFMRRFTVYFDYSRSQMILEPNAKLNDPFEGDMSGIAPRMGPDGSQALEVEWVQSVSPAAEAGIKAADLIEQVDGKPALEVGVPGLKEMFRHSGETHRLTIRRGEEHLEVSLTTRRLI